MKMTESRVLDKVEKKEHESKQEKTVPGKHYVPYTDIFERDDSLMVVMEIPGVEPKDLDINVEKNLLTIEGRINFSKYDNLKPLYTEYNVGHFSRSFSLSNEIDQSGITARVEDGVLSLTLPKAKEAATRRIQVH
jgi:HSP20 family molecular chaperone IbpA